MINYFLLMETELAAMISIKPIQKIFPLMIIKSLSYNDILNRI